MRTAYLTLDEVNASEAIRLGSDCGHAVHVVDLRSADLAGEARLVLDLDSLPPDDGERLLGHLAPALRERLAVHSRNLPPAVIRRLVRAGIVVRWHLDRTLFRRLGARRAAAATTA
jgi:hypothetical protein